MNTAPVLAAIEVNQESITPGLLGFFAIAFIGVVLFFLMRSMGTKLANVRSGALGEFDEAERPAGTAAASEASADTAAPKADANPKD